MTQLMRYDPSWVTQLERDIDTLLDRGFSAWSGSPWHRMMAPSVPAAWAPACDVFSRDGDLVVELALPGIDPEKDVQVTVQDGILCISGERHVEEDAGRDYYRREWRRGAFERGIRLPEGVTGDDITATYRAGVLEVVLPAAAKAPEPKRILVHSPDGKKTLTADEAGA
jgi:HSP20 family molecular chaperone IbpA